MNETAPPPAPPPIGPGPIDGKLPAFGQELIAPHFADSEHHESSRCPAFDITKRLEKKPIALWEESLAQGSCARFTGPKGAAILGVVLDGAVELEQGTTPRATLASWSGFRAPASKPVALYAPKGSARVLAIAIAARDATEPAPSTWSFLEQPDLAWGGGAYHARIGGDPTGAPAVVDALMLSRDGSIAEHTHDTSWECLAALAGAGFLVLEGVDTPITPGTITCVPQGKKHAWRPNGLTSLVAIQVYTPPGPEQRFKKLANP